MVNFRVDWDESALRIAPLFGPGAPGAGPVGGPRVDQDESSLATTSGVWTMDESGLRIWPNPCGLR